MNDSSLLSVSPLVTFGIPGIAAAVAVLGTLGYAAAGRGGARGFSRSALVRGLVFVAVWSSVSGLAAASGVLLRMDLAPPPFALMFLALVGLGLTLGFGRVGRRLTELPLTALVGVHAFRLPLELVMHRAAMDGLMPVHMSYSGLNFDVLTGVTAIPVAYLASIGRAPRALVLAWNVLGTGLLLTIMAVAMMSSPLFQLFGTDPRLVNTWVAHFPFVYLPTVLVVAALTGHIVLWRKLLGHSLSGVRSLRGVCSQRRAANGNG